MNGVSVIICCYNSAEKLPDTLQALALQQTPTHFPWEIILIDNNSTDNTARVAQHYWNSLSSPIPLTIQFEKKSGLSFAREAGIEQAQYDILLFCDDDNSLDSNYLQLGYQYLTQHPNVALLGGIGSAQIELTEIPNWFERYAYHYAVGSQAEHSKDITIERGFVYGAGCFLVKAAYKKLKAQQFSYTLTGRKGTALSSGEDNELGYAFSLIGFQIHYLDSLLFKHLLSSKRINLHYLKRLKKSVAYSSTSLIPYLAYRRLVFEGTPISFSWTSMFFKTLRVLFTNMLRYPFASATFKIDIALDSEARLGTLHALIVHRWYLLEQKNWLPWLKKDGLGKD